MKMFSKILKKNTQKNNSPASKNENCTEFEIDKWVLSDFIISKLVKEVGVRPYPLDELMLMAGAVCRFKPTHIFEWGTHVGKSARIFYETISYFNINSEIHSFDLPDDVSHVEHPHEQRGILIKNVSAVKLYQEDGLKKGIEIFEKSTTASKRAFFYLDGDHSYETVKNELTVILSKIPEAIILLHDTFYQASESGYNIGPFQAIEDYLLENNKEKFKVVSTKLGLPGMTLLYKNATI